MKLYEILITPLFSMVFHVFSMTFSMVFFRFSRHNQPMDPALGPPWGRQVVFQPQNVMTMARAGQPLSEVASQADVFIRASD